MCYYSKGAEGESPQRLLLYLGEMVRAILRDMPGNDETRPFSRNYARHPEDSKNCREGVPEPPEAKPFITNLI